MSGSSGPAGGVLQVAPAIEVVYLGGDPGLGAGARQKFGVGPRADGLRQFRGQAVLGHLAAHEGEEDHARKE